jgi:hypothetical protein
MIMAFSLQPGMTCITEDGNRKPVLSLDNKPPWTTDLFLPSAPCISDYGLWERISGGSLANPKASADF